MSLHGIGSAYAERIISERPFNSTSEITRVKGIGSVTYESIKNHISL